MSKCKGFTNNSLFFDFLFIISLLYDITILKIKERNELK